MPDFEEDKIIKVPRFEKKHGFSTTSQRSLLMSKIKGKNTSPEILLRKRLWQLGVRYRLHNNKLPGNPDITIKKYKLAIFIDGEFWHGYDWGAKKLRIKTNRDFWIPKIERNMQRDTLNNSRLEVMGFKVIRFWEKDIKKSLNTSAAVVLKYITEINN